MVLREITEGRWELKKNCSTMLTVWAQSVREAVWECHITDIIKVTIKTCFCILAY